MTILELIELSEEFLSKRKREQPQLALFRSTQQAFKRCVPRLSSWNLIGAKHTIMSTARAKFSTQPDTDPLLAAVFVDLWFCSNFSAARWQPLLTLDKSFIALAIDHCFYVWWSSGKDSTAELIQLLNTHSAWCEAEAALRRIQILDVPCAEWTKKVRNSQNA